MQLSLWTQAATLLVSISVLLAHRTSDTSDSLDVDTSVEQSTQAIFTGLTEEILSSSPDVDTDFYQYLNDANNFPRALIPKSHEIDREKYSQWKRHNSFLFKDQRKWRMQRKWKTEGGVADDDLIHISFENFVKQTQIQFGMFEGQLRSDASCILSFYRSGSGKSSDDTMKSYYWMFQLFEAYLKWSKQKEKNPKLIRCFSNSEGQLDIQTTKNFDEMQGKFVLILEDVSYSGTELIETLQMHGAKLRGNVANLLVMTSYVAGPVFDKLANLLRNRHSPLNTMRPTNFMFFPCAPQGEEMTTCSFPCKVMEQKGREFWVPACNVYFDHKMADRTSLGEFRHAAMGGWKDCRAAGTNQRRVRRGERARPSRSRNNENVAECAPAFEPPIPFIRGCEDVHECALALVEATHTFGPGAMGITYDAATGIVTKVISRSQASAKRIVPGYKIAKVGNDKYSKGALDRSEAGDSAYTVTFKTRAGRQLGRGKSCSRLLNCPYAPYKNLSKQSEIFEQCGCAEVVAARQQRLKTESDH